MTIDPHAGTTFGENTDIAEKMDGVALPLLGVEKDPTFDRIGAVPGLLAGDWEAQILKLPTPFVLGKAFSHFASGEKGLGDVDMGVDIIWLYVICRYK